jgi:hypothetical protein
MLNIEIVLQSAFALLCLFVPKQYPGTGAYLFKKYNYE